MIRSRSSSIALALLVFLLGCGPDTTPVEQAWKEYDRAFKAEDLDRVAQLVLPEKATELTAVGARETFELAAAMRPSNVVIDEATIDGDVATLSLTASLMGQPAAGTVTFELRDGRWLLRDEAWEMGELVAPSTDSIPSAVMNLIDAMASDDPKTGSQAWLDLGARYGAAEQFLGDVRPALWDTRPISFSIVEETFRGSSGTIRYFTAKSSASGANEGVRTVGQALRYHLWQLEDVSGSGFSGGFSEWWVGYAIDKGLPAN